MRLVSFIVTLLFLSAVSAEWQVLHESTTSLIIGFRFLSDQRTGWIVGADLSLPSSQMGFIMKTQDEGRSWVNQTPSHNKAVFFLDIDSPKTDGNVGLVSDISEEQLASTYYTTNSGQTWNPSTVNFRGVYQFVQLIDRTQACLFGEWNSSTGLQSGVAISRDGGKTYVRHPWKLPGGATSYTQTLTGHFLNANYGFLVSFTLDTQLEQENNHPLKDLPLYTNDRLRLLYDYLNAKGQTKKAMELAALPFFKFHKSKAPTFSSEIVKTTNGGSTFSVVYSTKLTDEISSVYFTDTNNGWATYEIINEMPPSVKGVIVRTADGGKTWTKEFESKNASVILGVEFTDTTEGWAFGVEILPGTTNVTGIFWHTKNAGKTWDFVTTSPGYIPIEIHAPAKGLVYVMAVRFEDEVASSLLKYTL